MILAYKNLQKKEEKLAQDKKFEIIEKNKLKFTIMSVTEITQNGETFIMKDQGLEVFVIEYTDLLHYSELTGYPFVRFRCHDDYSKFFDINFWLHFLYSEKCDRSSP